MSGVIIDQGDGYTITSYHNGLSYLIKRDADSADAFIQGDEAVLWRKEYNDLYADHGKRGTRASRFTWRQLLDEMCGAYFV